MKKKLLFFYLITFLITMSYAQNDTIFVMKNGIIINQTPTSDVDSIIFYRPVISNSGSFVDSRDNTTYSTILIGNQVWMAENLKYLPSVSSANSGSDVNPIYYVYNYNGADVLAAKATSNFTTYGVLYNWSAAMTACPTGWHLPTNQEWITLTTLLGGETIAGGKLKETGFTHWTTPNISATNETGFNGLPGGMRDIYTPLFYHLNNIGYWWSSTEYTSTSAKGRALFYNYTDCEENHHGKGYGFSVRCIMN